MRSTRPESWRDPAQLEFGVVVAERYRVDGLIGQGASAVVYRAFDLRHEREVALKVLRFAGATSDPTFIRFVRESGIGSELQHPALPVVYEAGIVEQTEAPYLAMELLEGETLAQRLRRGPLELDELLPVVESVTDALEHAHERGIVHRDVKPSNIFLSIDHLRRTQVKLLDFGVGFHTSDTRVTASGVIVGTPGYLAPEQLIAAAEIGPLVDLYALGIVMYRALTGAMPFKGRTAEELGRDILTGQPPLPSTLCDVDPGVDAVVLRAMARLPPQRFQSARELFAALRVVSATLRPVRRGRDDETTKNQRQRSEAPTES